MKKADYSDHDQSGFSGQKDSTFLTMAKTETAAPYTLHDLLFPAGKVAKLV